ncbi:MAG: hypothetical protein RIT81_11870 [Deltaproteobacteria bacterium]
MANVSRISNTSSACSSCTNCRGGACSACKNCPSCASNRQGARSTLDQLRKMLQQDPSVTQNGVNDAFNQDASLGNNPVLMKVLHLLGLQAPAQG